MPHNLRVGIVGFGGMGQGHARTLGLIDGMDLVAVSDPSKAARNEARQLGAIPYESHVDMLDGTDIDAVIVSSPSNTHGLVVTDCCSKGINIFCEKPLTTTFSEALEVLKAVQESGIVFSFGLVLRHSEMYAKAKQMIDDGEIGEVGMADCRYSGYMLGRYEYVFSEEMGRGLINEHTIHMIDVMEYLLGPVVSVYAKTDANWKHTEYNAAVIMTHESGAFTAVSGSGVSRLGGFSRITGMKGELLIEGNRQLLLKDDAGEREIISAELGYREELEDFKMAILDGTPPLTGLKEAFSCSRLIEAVYRSAENGDVIQPETLG